MIPPNPDNIDDENFDDVSAEEEEEDRTELGTLPEWANEENSKLHKKLQALEQERDKLEAELLENKETITTVSGHFKNVEEELVKIQALNNIKQKHIEQEKHSKSREDRKLGKANQELKVVKRKRAVVEDALNNVKNDQFDTRERQEKLVLEKDWNNDAMSEWKEAVKQKEDDMKAYAAYTRADEKKVKQLSLTQEKLTEQCKAIETQLEEEVTETRVKQIELDKAIDQYRTLHKDRQTLVQQWQDALETMHRRNKEIVKAGHQYGRAMKELEDRHVAVIGASDNLDQLHKDNKELTSHVGMKERILTKKRENQQEVSRVVAELGNQTQIMKTELQRAAEALEQGRIANQNQNRVLEQKRERLDLAREQLQKVKMDVEKSNIDSDNVESMAKRHEEVLKGHEAEVEKQEKSIEGLKEVQFKHNHILFELRKEESDLIAEIEGARAAGKNLRDKIRRLDSQSLRQQELVYNAEFQIQQLERRVARAGGMRTDEEKKVLNAKIDDLRDQLTAVSDQNKMLKDQRKKLDDDVRRNQRFVEILKGKAAKLNSEIDELVLRNSTAEQEMTTFSKSRETRMLEHDTLKLEVNKLKASLSSRADEVSGLENRKYQLQKSMQERREEINVVMQHNMGKVKGAEDAKHQAVTDLNICEKKLEGLRAKYESVRMYLSEGGEQKTQSYFIIKAAQRKEELKRLGDSLDSKIQKTAKELSALKKTLKHMLRKNTSFRKDFHNADSKSDAARKLKRLQAQAKQSADNLFTRKKQLHRLRRDTEDLEFRMESIGEQHVQAKQRKQNLTSALQIVQRELKEAEEKLFRSSSRVQKESKQHREGLMDATEVSVEEKMMRAQAIQENNQNVLFTLTELANEFPEIESSLAMALTKENLRLPQRPPSAASSTASTS